MWLAVLVLAGTAAAIWAIDALWLSRFHAGVLPGHRPQCMCHGCNLHRLGDQKRRI